MKPLPTVTIRRDNMNVRINASDYEEERDGPIVQGDGQDQPAPMLQTNQPGASIGAVSVPDGGQGDDPGANDSLSPEAVTSGPVASAVVKKGRKWFVSDAQGNPVTDEGIDAAGYSTEADAWAAIMTVKG